MYKRLHQRGVVFFVYSGLSGGINQTDFNILQYSEQLDTLGLTVRCVKD